MSTEALKDVPMSEARNELPSLAELLAGTPGAVAITLRGRPVLALLPWEFYESIVETLEVLGDKELMAALRRGLREAGKGKSVPWAKARKELTT